MKSFAPLILALSGISAAAFAADTAFYNEAAQGGMAEVALGRLAATKASDEKVKSFGRQMVTDHTAANTKLKAAAEKSNVMLPTSVAPDAQATQKKLESLSGKEFDRAYIESQVKDHAKTIALLEKEIASGTDTNAKAWATESLPVVRMHATMVGNLEGMPAADHGAHAPGTTTPPTTR